MQKEKICHGWGRMGNVGREQRSMTGTFNRGLETPRCYRSLKYDVGTTPLPLSQGEDKGEHQTEEEGGTDSTME